MKDKMKSVYSELRRLGGSLGSDEHEIWDTDYDDLGRDFILVGG